MERRLMTPVEAMATTPLDADVLIVCTPMWNWSVPQRLKQATARTHPRTHTHTCACAHAPVGWEPALSQAFDPIRVLRMHLCLSWSARVLMRRRAFRARAVGSAPRHLADGCSGPDTWPTVVAGLTPGRRL